jgi:hypothetical protein
MERKEPDVEEESVRVYCVDQEYWYLRRSRCTCGGRFEKLLQVISEGPSGPQDVIEAACTSCGKARTFAFDISEFYGKATGIIMDAPQVKDKDLGRKSIEASAPCMEEALGYMRKLADSGETLALEYLEDAIRHFREKAMLADSHSGPS